MRIMFAFCLMLTIMAPPFAKADLDATDREERRARALVRLVGRARAQRPRRARDGRAQAERQGIVRYRPQRLQRRDRLDPHPADDADDDQAVGQGAERERRGARRLPPERGEAAGEGDDARPPASAVRGGRAAGVMGR